MENQETIEENKARRGRPPMHIKDRLEIMSSQDINFIAHGIKMTKGAAYPIDVDKLEELKKKIPNFAQMLNTGIVKIVK